MGAMRKWLGILTPPDRKGVGNRDIALVQLFSFREINTVALLNENEVAPAFSIPNQDGNAVSLEQFKGQHVVLWWYPKADTPG